MGEGGALLIRSEDDVEKAEIIREKGTNRSRFLRGQIDKYTWVEAGSSYLPSDMNAAYLWAQLQEADMINNNRLASWDKYYKGFEELENKGFVTRPFIPEECKHNAHMFYLKAESLETRTKLISFLKENSVLAVFHYVPLHSAPAGQRFGEFVGEDKYTTAESDRLLRLPMYYGLTDKEVEYVIEKVYEFYKG
jgi:dTDP-4-amino-4,6-dideoxygalactose transaminase